MEEPVCKVDEYGNQRWHLNGLLHRTDGPAMVRANGSQWWYQNDRLHRTDGPAVVLADGNQWWYQNGQIHRTDGPAVVWANGSQWWFINDRDITGAVEQWMNKRNIRWPWPDEETSTQLKNQLTYF